MSPTPIISIAQMRAMDAAAPLLGVPTRGLMENAGEALAQAVMARFSPRPTAILCGPGANGGDGWVCARLLHRAGWPVWVETLVSRDALRGDPADAAAAFAGPIMALGDPACPAAALAVDALFGAGLNKPLEGAARAAALAWAHRPEAVVAADTPSGVPGDGGPPLGDVAFRAGLTVSFEALKPAHVLEPWRSFCGETIIASIGMPPQAFASAGAPLATANGPALWGAAFPRPGVEAHKHSRGHVMVVSGGLVQTGAARLAAISALRAGAGLVTVLSPPDAVRVHAAHLTAVMLREIPDLAALEAAIKEADAVVIGPALGLAADFQDHVLAVCRGGAPAVLDADVFSLFRDQAQNFFQALRPSDVLTPHRGEFQRVFPELLEVTPNRIAAAKAAAILARATVLLKGPDTVIAAPDGRCAVNGAGTPYLATAGSGDVLAGVIAGLLAQGMDSFLAASAGAWLHGQCGEALGPGLIAEDLPSALPGALRSVLERRSTLGETEA